MDPAQAPDPPLSLLIARMEVFSVDEAPSGIPTQQGLGGDLHNGSFDYWPPPRASYLCPS